jgi:hypothetical protein
MLVKISYKTDKNSRNSRTDIIGSGVEVIFSQYTENGRKGKKIEKFLP